MDFGRLVVHQRILANPEILPHWHQQNHIDFQIEL
jgi:hypothetical protein